MSADSLTIERILTVEKLPEPGDRKPNTIYILEHQGKEERDRYLGAFMDRWSEMERQLLLLLQVILKVPCKTAEVIFHSATSIKTPLEMTGGLLSISHAALLDEWKSIEKDCFELSNHRNHLVHGYWVRDVLIDRDSDNNPIVHQINWIRVYMTGDPELNERAAYSSGRPKTGGHRYDLPRIKRKLTAVVEQHKAISTLREKIGPITPTVEHIESGREPKPQ